MSVTENIQIPWPGWQIVRSLGRGSYGVVYEIERDVFGKKEKAALKIISIPKDSSEVESDYTEGYDEKSITEKYSFYLKKIVEEYQLMAEMKGHSNIVNCDDFAYLPHEGGIGWDVFIRMELLKPLKSVLREGDLSEEQVAKLGRDICRALVFCEQKNIIHRDIKPENIMVSAFGDFKLGDFGVARTMDHTTHATRTGTDRYMAPEVIKREKYGQDADIYSLGIVLYWLLNRRRLPFLPVNRIPTEPEVNEAESKRVRGVRIPAPVNGSSDLKRIVLKACSYRREERYHSAGEMLSELETGETAFAGRERDMGQVSGTSRTNADSTKTNKTNVGRTSAGSTYADCGSSSGKTMGTAGNDWNGSQGTAGNDWEGTGRDAGNDWKGSGGTVGNNWNDTQGTIGAPGGYEKQQEAQYEKTVGAYSSPGTKQAGTQEAGTGVAPKAVAATRESAVKSIAVKVYWKRLMMLDVAWLVFLVCFAIYSEMYDAAKKAFIMKIDSASILCVGAFIAVTYVVLMLVLVGRGKILGFLLGYFQGVMLMVAGIASVGGDFGGAIGVIGGLVWIVYHFCLVRTISNACRDAA